MPTVLSNLDMGQRQILGGVIEVLASAPGSPAEGRVYFDSTLDALRVYTGAAWTTLGAGGGGGGTASILLPILAAVLPDGSTNNAPAQFQRVKSSAAAPSAHLVELLFDASAREHAYWVFRMPASYSSAPVAKLQWKANATSGSVVWDVRIAAITPADADTPNEKALGSANTATTAANATEARRLVETSVTLTNADSVAAGDLVVLLVSRDAANGADTGTVDAELVAVSLEYTAV